MNFDKTGYQLTLYPLQSSDDANHGNWSMHRQSSFIFKSLYEYEDIVRRVVSHPSIFFLVYV